MLKLLQADQAQVVHRDFAPLVVRQSRLQLEPEQDVAHHIEPGEQGRFLEHDKALLARAGSALPVSQTLTALGLVRPAMMSRSVDLPQPLGPRRQTNSPSNTVRDTFSKASTVALFDQKRFETPSMMSLGRAGWG